MAKDRKFCKNGSIRKVEMVMTDELKPQRTPWQRAAAARYPKMYFLGGDGALECFVILSRCKHQQVRKWRYALRPTEAEAQALLDKWNKDGCVYNTCTGEHSLWRLVP